MIGTRSIRWFLVGAAILGMGLACDKGGAGGGGKIQGAASAAVDILPKETGLVVGFSWSSFKDSSLYNMLVEAIPQEAKDKLKEVKDTCGIDAMNDLESVIIGAGGNLDQSRMLFLIKGKWNEEKVTKCAVAMGPKMGKTVTSAKEGNITTYTVEGQPPMHIGWVGDVMVFTPSAAEGDKTFLSDMLKQKSTVKDNKPFMDLLGKCDTSATVYAAVLPPADSDMSKGLQQLTKGQEKLAGAWLTLALSKKLDAYVGLRTGADAEAKTVAEKLNGELEGAKKNPQVGEFLKSASVTTSGADVNLKINLDEASLNKLTEMLKQIAPMLPMMLGGR